MEMDAATSIPRRYIIAEKIKIDDPSLIIEEMLSTINEFRLKDECFEIRILGKRIVSGYFQNTEHSLKDLKSILEKWVSSSAIYFTLNSVNPAVMARSSNKMTEGAKITTSDNDIGKIDYFHIDLDPVRPAGISSTDEELELAYKKAKEIKIALAVNYDITDPIMSCSGNGYNLDYYIGGIENTNENKERLKNVLKALDMLFSDNRVKVDTTTFNPSRIIKLFGCISNKGDHTRERPHRFTFIDKAPSEKVVISIEKLDELVKVLPKGNSNKRKTTNGNSFDIKQTLIDNGFKIAKEVDESDKTKYILEQCPWNEQHTNQSAYVIKFNNGGIAAGCLHEGCKDKKYKDLKKLLVEETLESTEDSEAYSDQLYNLVINDIQELFVDQLDIAYLKIDMNGMTPILKVSDKKLKNYLQVLFKRKFSKLAKRDVVKQVAEQLSAEAEFSGNRHTLELRVNRHDDALYYDLANDKYEVVKITPTGYEIVTDYPIIFTRNRNTVPQVRPTLNVTDTSDYFTILAKHFRFKDENDRFLFGIYLILCFVSGINHPILILFGEKGASKSTTARGTKKIVDPSRNELFSIPTSKNDMAVSLVNSCMICFDNLQALNLEKSDLLCMASTGGMISKRMLFSDSDEVLLEIHRTVVLNGINIAATQPDLLDRSILVELDRIPETERKTEEKVWREFESDLPKLLGIIFNTLSKAMSTVPVTELQGYSRMADFSLWGYCVAEALGYEGQSFVNIYKENQLKSNEEAISANPLAMCIIKLMSNKLEYESTVGELLTEIETIADNEHYDTKDRGFPKAPHALSRKLREMKSNLESVGISFGIRHAGNAKVIKITKI